MAQTPYRPYPSADAQFIPTPELRLSTPLAAFGGGVAQAIESVGGNVKEVGGELWQRAVALQELSNESEAREANANYMIEVGKRHAEFSSLEGKAAVDAAPGYYAGLKQLRDQMTANLSNPDVKKRFETEATGTMARTIFNGAGHAAAENKRWHKDTLTAANQAAIDELAQNPNSDAAFENAKTTIEKNSHEMAALSGWEGEEGEVLRQQYERDQLSKLYAKKLTEMARFRPREAQRLLEENGHNLGSRLEQVKNTIETRLQAQDARGISHSVNSDLLGGDPADEPLNSRIRRGVDAAKKMRPEDDVFQHEVERVITQDYNEYKKRGNDEQNTYKNIIADGILGANTGGNIPKNMDELLADPKVRAAYDAMKPRDKLQVPGQLDRYRNAYTHDTNQETYFKLKGMAEADPLGFVGQDITKEQLAPSQMKELIALQGAKRKNAEQAPQVRRAIGILTDDGQLGVAGISKQSNPDRYNTFVGALQDALVYHQQTTGKPAGFEEVREIGKRLLKYEVTKGKFWNSYDRFFEYSRNLPTKDLNAIKQKIMKDNPDAEPTDEEIMREVARQKYIEATRPKGSTQPAKSPKQSRDATKPE